MAHNQIPPNAVFPGDNPTGQPWTYQGTAVISTVSYADVWSTDTTGVTVSWLRVMFRPTHHFTDAGVAAAVGLANSYLTSGHATSIGNARHMAGIDAGGGDFSYCDVGRKTLHYVVAAADVATQVAAILSACQTGANVA
jgi:hypothetical protein